MLNDSYYINLQLSKMREKVQAVNNPVQYLNTLNLAESMPSPSFLALFQARVKGGNCAAVSATAVYVEPLLSCQSGARQPSY